MRRTLTYAQAISEATVQCMEADPSIFVAGIGVDDHVGIFGTTRAAFERFGKERVVDIPNMENAFAGIAIGAAAVGKRPIVVHPRVDFSFLATDMLINLAAKWAYMYQNGTRVPVVVRAIVGREWGQGATHSQSLHALYGHFPGLVVAAPAFPNDAKGLMVAALRATAPTVIIEHRSCFELAGLVDEGMAGYMPGTGRIERAGNDITIVGASYMAVEAVRAAVILSAHGISAEVVNPRYIRPLDKHLILDSLARTGHLVVADTSWATYGFAAEIAALAAEHSDLLRRPVRRVTPADCPAPVSKPLQDAFHPNAVAIAQACLDMLAPGLEVPAGAAEHASAFFKGPY